MEKNKNKYREYIKIENKKNSGQLDIIINTPSVSP